LAEKKESIGAFWIKKSKKGMTFMSGTVEIDGKKTEVVVFKNDKGDNEKRPDYRMYESEPLEQDKPAATQDDDDGVPF